MTALYIIAGIVGFLFLLLIIPAVFEVRLSDDVSVVLRYAFLRFSLMPSKKEKPAGGKRSDEKKKDERDETPKEGLLKRMIREKGVSGAIGEIIEVVKRIFKGVTGLLRHIKIRRFKLAVTVATDDAAKTGVEYGAVCALLYPAIGLLGTFCDLGQAGYGVAADFDAKESKVTFDGVFSVLPLFVLSAAVYVAAGYIKLKISDNKTVRKM